VAQWLIESIEVTGGFLAGLSLQLPPGLTCIIGPRGSGKSTLAEAIRYGLLGAGGASKLRADLIQANLGASLVTIRTAPDQRGESYVIRRSYRQPATIVSSEGRTMTTIDLERGTFLPLDAYGTAEIESIADESFGARRRALLDELIGDDLRQVLLTVSERRRDLESNADAIKATQRLIIDLTEQIEEIGDARVRLATLPPIEPGQHPSGLVQSAQQQQTNDREARNLTKAATVTASFRQDLHELIRKRRAELSQPLAIEGSANSVILQAGERTLAGALSTIERLLADLDTELVRAEESLQQIDVKLQAAHVAHKAEYDRLQQQDLAASQAVRERSLREQEVAHLMGLESQRQEARGELTKLLALRDSLKGSYLLDWEKISQLRTRVAAQLQQQAGNKVRIRVLVNADILGYQQMLTEGLRGAHVRNHEDILATLLRLRPEELAQIVRDNDLTEFEQQTSLGKERSAKIVEAFRKNLDLFDLELVTIDDQVRIELNVASTSDPHFKDATELSRGQKCTALLPLLLARRDTPLIIDQPEDNLDNHFIYETVVDAIGRLKPRRQMVFITHNANIPVLGDADLVVVMNSDGKRGFIEKTGGLDDCREEIIDLLEGGHEAFELRRQRYAKA
jgi:ABC-type cobalamin/Fe3+-siderophores transport system ATPase subunit